MCKIGCGRIYIPRCGNNTVLCFVSRYLLEECLTLLASGSDPTCRDALSRCTKPTCRGKPESPTRCLVTAKLRLYEETTHGGTTRSVPVRVLLYKYCVVKYCIHRCNYVHLDSRRKITVCRTDNAGQIYI